MPIQQLTSADDSINVTGTNDDIQDFGGSDTYQISPFLSGNVVIADNQASTIILPAGMTISEARFTATGLQFDINGNTLELQGDVENFTFVFGGDPLNPATGTALSFTQLAEAFGTTVPTDDSVSTGTNSGEINADGTVGAGIDPETFALEADAADADEGTTATFTLTTENVAEGTEVAYTISGVDAADVDGPLTGTATVGADGTATISVALVADELTEGPETLTVALDNGEGSADVIVNDTSLTPVAELVADAESADEGSSATFSLTNGEANTTYTFGISGVDAADVDGGALIGTATTDADGNATISVDLAADRTTEGEETLTVTIFNTDLTASTIVNDTSLDNVAPVAEDGTLEVGEADAPTSGQLVATDAEGDALTFALDAAIDGLSLNPDGSYTFDPSANAAAQALLYTDAPLVLETTYTVTDALGAVSGTQTLSITVTPTPLTFDLTSGAPLVGETDTLTFTVTASEAVAVDTDVTFNLLPGNGTAANTGTADTNTGDFGPGAFNPVTVTIAAGGTEASFDVTPVGDALTELPEGFSVTASIAGEDDLTLGGTVLDDVTVGTDPGQIFTLTTDADNPANLVGVPNPAATPLGNVFNAPLETAIGGLVGVQTLQDPDVLIGSAEADDELNADLNGTGAGGVYASPTVSDIEIFNLSGRAGALSGPEGDGLDLGDSTGYTQLWNRGSNGDLTLDDVGEDAIIGLDGVKGGTAYNVNFSGFAGLGTQTVVADNVGSFLDGQAELDIDTAGGSGPFALDLMVSNGVQLDLDDDAANMFDLNIHGSGFLNLSGEGEFPVLDNLNSTGYTGPLVLDVSGSTGLLSVMTGDQDDFVTVNTLSVDGDLSVDMGEDTGAPGDILEINGTTSAASMDAVDFTGGVTGVENIAFGDGFAPGGTDAELDLSGVSMDLEAVWFFTGVTGGGSTLSLANSPVTDLILNTSGVDDLHLDAGNVVNIDINNSSGTLDLDSVTGEALVSLDVAQNSSSDLYLDIFSNATKDVSVLESVMTTAVGNSDVDFDASDPDADIDALKTVNVVATGGDSDLTMTGMMGTAEIVGVQQVEEFTVDVGGAGTQSGDIIFTSGDLTSGFVATDYSESGGFFAPTRDNGSARDVATDLDADPDLNATFPNIFGFPTGNTVTVEWDSFGPKQQLSVLSAIASSGSISSPFAGMMTTLVTPGVTPEAAIFGEGFAGLETVVVDGSEDANVDLDDVYGAFSLDVTAGVDAVVDVNETNAVSVSVAAGMDADIDVTGPIYGNPNLVSVTVASSTTDVDLSDDLSSFTMLDLMGVTSEFDVDSSAAEFAPGAGESVSYLIGATDSGEEDEDSSILMNDARETVTFTMADFGTVVLDNFTDGADPATGDRVDLSQLGFTNNGQLLFEEGTYAAGTGVFTADGGDDIRISDLAGGPEMSGEIILLGLFDSNDLTNFNMIYA